MSYHVYLAGPIVGLSFDDSVNWREQFIQGLPPEIVGLSPLRGKDYLEQERTMQASYAHHELSSARGLTARDFNDVKRSDLVIANLSGTGKVSIGTVMEIAWAKAFQIPVILVMERTGNLHQHPMIQESISFQVDTLEEALWLTKVVLMPGPHRKLASQQREEQRLQEMAEVVEF